MGPLIPLLDCTDNLLAFVMLVSLLKVIQCLYLSMVRPISKDFKVGLAHKIVPLSICANFPAKSWVGMPIYFTLCLPRPQRKIHPLPTGLLHSAGVEKSLRSYNLLFFHLLFRLCVILFFVWEN